MPKRIYKELLESRAHLLTERQVGIFNSLFAKMADEHGLQAVGFKPEFKHQYQGIAKTWQAGTTEPADGKFIDRDALMRHWMNN